MEGWLEAESGGTPISVNPRAPALGTRCCLPGAPRPVAGGEHRVSLSTGMLENGWVQPRAEWMRILCPRRCPGSLPAATLVPRRGQPDLRGNLLPYHRATPSCSPSARCRLPLLWQGGCQAGPGQLSVSYRAGGCRAKGTGLCLAAGDRWILAHGGYKEFPGAAAQQAGRGGTRPGPRCWLTGCPKSRSGAGAHGARPLQLCCAEQPSSSLAIAGAGSRERSRHLHFRRLFSGAGEKPRRDEIVTKETRETGPGAGKRWAVRRGEGRAHKAPGPTHQRCLWAPRTCPSTQHSPARLGGQ